MTRARRSRNRFTAFMLYTRTVQSRARWIFRDVRTTRFLEITIAPPSNSFTIIRKGAVA